MLDHVGLVVSDYLKSKSFFEQALAPLGYKLMMEHGISGGGFGRDGKPDFWIKQGAPPPPASLVDSEVTGCGGTSIHVAFSAGTRAMVEAFHRAALAAGGRDNGAPRLRAEYHPNYYGAFVLDPDGYNIEAVCHLAK